MPQQIESIDKGYGLRIILTLDEKGEIPLSGFRDVCSHYDTLRRIINDLEGLEIVEIKKQHSPYRRFTVLLTKKGKKIAKKINELNELM